MNNPKKPLCIIPARGGSKRFQRKNIALLAGKSLLVYAIETALESNLFDRICVSSDDEGVLEIARKYGTTSALKRPAELATDNIQVKHVCRYILDYFKKNKGINYAEFGLLLPTNPLRDTNDIRKAYKIFKKKDADCIMSLVPYTHPPQRAVWVNGKYAKPYFGLKYMKQTQLLVTLYRHDGSIIFCKSDTFLKEGEFYSDRVIPYFIPIERSVDIDTPLDLKWAEFLLCNKTHGEKHKRKKED